MILRKSEAGTGLRCLLRSGSHKRPSSQGSGKRVWACKGGGGGRSKEEVREGFMKRGYIGASGLQDQNSILPEKSINPDSKPPLTSNWQCHILKKSKVSRCYFEMTIDIMFQITLKSGARERGPGTCRPNHSLNEYFLWVPCRNCTGTVLGHGH